MGCDAQPSGTGLGCESAQRIPPLPQAIAPRSDSDEPSREHVRYIEKVKHY